jgi:hypothetical protein
VIDLRLGARGHEHQGDTPQQNAHTGELPPAVRKPKCRPAGEEEAATDCAEVLQISTKGYRAGVQLPR